MADAPKSATSSPGREDAPPSTPAVSSDVLQHAYREGARAVREAADAAGGLWSSGEVAVHLGVEESDVARWRARGEVLVLLDARGRSWYPVAQYDDGWPGRRGRPHSGMDDILRAAGALPTEELLYLLSARHPALAAPDDGMPRTGWEALAAGDVSRVVGLLHWLTASDDG